jgi:hypothetical protein
VFGTKFWDQIASSTAQKWVERLLSPALAFWGGSLLAYAYTKGWAPVMSFLQHLDTPLQIVLALSGVVLIAGSATAVESLQQDSLRLLEGYWPRLFRRLRRYLVGRISGQVKRMDQEWQELAARYDALTPEELEDYARLDAALATFPSQARLLPTRLGNRLRAAEDYPWRHYGLGTGVLWPRLWGVMPQGMQKEITEARKRLDAAVRLFLWSVLFLVWTPLTWWVIPLGLLGMIGGYWQALNAAGVYGELLRAAFDLHRFALYKALHWPLPSHPAEEHPIGRQLTDYLWRGSKHTKPLFTVSD